MHIFVGDESGLIKVVDYEKKKLVKKYRSQRANNAVLEIKYYDETTLAATTIDGCIDFIDTASSLVKASLDIKNFIKLPVDTTDDPALFGSFFTLTSEAVPPLSVSKRVFVSSHFTKDNKLAVCDRSGNFFYFKNLTIPDSNNPESGQEAFMELFHANKTFVQAKDDSGVEPNSINSIAFKVANDIFNYTNPAKHVEVMRVCEENPNIYVISGRNTNVRVFDIASKTPHEPVYESENLPNDRLDIEIPIWDRDLVLVPGTMGTQVYTVTNTGDIRYYDFKIAKKPLFTKRVNGDVLKDRVTHFNLEVSLTRIAYADPYLIVTTTKGLIFRVGISEIHRSIHKADRKNAPPERKNNSFDDEDDTTNFTIELNPTYFLQVDHFALKPNGSIRDIIVHPSLPIFAVCSIDRFVYIYDLETRAPLQKIYLKQRLTSIVFRTDEDFKRDPANQQQQQQQQQQQGVATEATESVPRKERITVTAFSKIKARAQDNQVWSALKNAAPISKPLKKRKTN